MTVTVQPQSLTTGRRRPLDVSRPRTDRSHPATPGGVPPRHAAPMRDAISVDPAHLTTTTQPTEAEGVSDRTLAVIVVTFAVTLLMGFAVAVGALIAMPSEAESESSVQVVAVR